MIKIEKHPVTALKYTECNPMKFNKKDAFPMVQALRAEMEALIQSHLKIVFPIQSITFLAKKCNVQHTVDSFADLSTHS